MKRIVSLLSAAFVAGLFLSSCNNAAPVAASATQADTTAAAGSIVFFNIDKVVESYDMANDLRSVVETKVNGIQSEIDRRGNKLQKDANDFQNKMDKGLLTTSVANAQYQKLPSPSSCRLTTWRSSTPSSSPPPATSSRLPW